MPRPATSYDAVLTTESVEFEMSSYQIWREDSSNTELVKCDLCGRLLQLVGVNRSTTYLKRHRNKQGCQSLQRQNNPPPEAPLVFVNSFLEVAPSQIRLYPSESPDDPLELEASNPTTPTTPTRSSNVTPRRLSRESGTILDDSLEGYLPPSSPPPESPNSENDLDDLIQGLGDTVDGASLPENLCQGQVVVWTAGSLWDTYAYQQHDDNRISWTPIGYEGPQSIRLRSKKCGGLLASTVELNCKACSSCFALLNSPQLLKFMERSKKDIIPHTPWKYLNSFQLKNMIVIANKKANAMKLKLLNANRKNGRLQRKLNDYQRMVMLISQNKIAGVSRILTVALKNGASAEALCAKLQRAIDGIYAPRSGWTSREFDIAFLVKAIGGPRLLYALQKAEGYPSLSTLRQRKPIPELSVSLGVPTKDDFDTNITALLGEKGRKSPPDSKQPTHWVVVMDGAAIEGAIRLDFKRKSLLGLCREHSKEIKKSVDNIADIYAVSDALDTDKTCHYGKDATVVGIAPITGRNNYHITPLVLSSSCKTETGDELAKWVNKFITCYRQHPDGEKRHGPIYTVATDGEASFRKLRFVIGLSETIDKNSELGKKLSGLPGLNLQTGTHGLLGTCDPKHIVKRFATMLRSPKGIQVGGTIFSSIQTLYALKCLPHMTHEKAVQLLNPADKQNVPKAVNLIQSLMDLIDLERIPGTPTDQQNVRAIILTSKILGKFLLSFINVELSLSEQIRNLSAYSHLITALYKRHGLGFMTSALIADSQAIVKNIIFTTARFQILNPDMLYYILFEGTDRIENVFSHVRTLDHARNFDIQQLSQKLSIATEIDSIFERHPDLNRGHVRRNLVNARGVDHMNPKSWIGNVRVGNVDIRAEYFAGREDANNLLVEYFHSRDEAFDFHGLFSLNERDHLRPNGIYIGSRRVDDADEDDVEEDLSPGQLETEPDTVDDDMGDANTAIDIDDFNGLDVQHKDLLNPPAKKSDAHYLTVNGERHYIPTLITQLLGANRENRALVTTRGLRVRGQTIERALRGDLNTSGDSLDIAEGKAKAGDLGAVLTRVRDYICLAVVEVLHFRQGVSKTNLAAVDVDGLDGDGSKATTVAVQILELVSAEPQSESEELTWWWPQRYIQLLDNEGGPLLQRHLVTRISGKLFHPLAPKIIYDATNHPVWSLNHGDLERALVHAWSDLDPESTNIIQAVRSLPIVTGPGSEKLPYRLLESETWKLFVSNDDMHIPLNLVKLAGDDRRKCHFCNQILRISDMRNHVGIHILKAHRDVMDSSLQNGMEIGSNPCGWCGKDGCQTHLTQVKNSFKITSNCEYHYQNMQYRRAAVSTNQTPCTNIPIICPLCTAASKDRRGTFWKYEFMTHMMENHLNDSNELPFLPLQLWATTHISQQEENQMGIPQAKTAVWREHYQVLDSDDIEVIIAEDVEEEEGDNYASDEEVEETSRSRKRGISIASTSSRQGSPTKRHQGSTG